MYNITYDVTGIFMVSVILILHYFLFDMSTFKSRIFRGLCAFIILECGFDIISALNIDGIIKLPDIASSFLLILYYIVETATTTLGVILVCLYFNVYTSQSAMIFRSVFAGSVGIFIVNIFYPYAFWFENGIFISKAAYVVFFVPSFVLFFYSIGLLIKSYKSIEKSARIGAWFYFATILIAFALQRVFPQLLLAGIAKALSMILFLSLFDNPEHEKLEKIVDELTIAHRKELDAISAVNEANQRKTAFLTKMSHETRTPINAILGLADILKREGEGENLSAQANELHLVGDELLDQINFISDFSQMETGHIELEAKEYRLENAYRLIFSYLHNILDEAGIQIDNKVSEQIPKKLYGDIHRTSVVLNEVAKCIVRRGNKGSISLEVILEEIKKRSAYITFKLKYTSNGINIIDGLDKNDTEYMYMSKMLEAMDSALVVYYSQSEGNVFSFTFRQEIVDIKPIGDIKNLIANMSGKELKGERRESFIMPQARVLVVDDTPINLLLFDRLTKPYQIQLTKAGSGQEAIDLMMNEEFDIVFMDIMMPEMDGVEALHVIKSSSLIESKDVPIIALTANVFLGARDKYISEGFTEYIPKPVNGKMLSDTLKHYLSDMVREDWAEVEVAKKEELEEDNSEVSFDEFFALGNSESQNFDGLSLLGNTDSKEPSLFASSMEFGESSLFGNQFEGDELGAELINDENLEQEEDISFENVPGLNIRDGISFCGSFDAFKDVVKTYCDETVDERLEEFYINKDWDNYRILIHGIKAPSKAIGLNRLYEGALALEMAAKESDVTYIDTNHSSWINEYITVVDMLRQIISRQQ